MTGYFGIPGRFGGAVHFTEGQSAVPICNVALSPEARFQWCSPRWVWEWLECKRCRKIALKSLSDCADK